MSDLKLIYGHIITKLRNEIAENEAKHEAALEKEREASLFVMRRLQDAMDDLKEAIAKYDRRDDE